MRNVTLSVITAVAAIIVSGTAMPGTSVAVSSSGAHSIEFEKMTWVEVKEALAAGKTTALVYTGGVEQRGPQNANGGHNLMAHATVEAIARKLGNAIFLPVLPYTPNNADAELPGTLGITGELLGAILERIADQAIVNGFKNVILMGDHGGGQPNVYQDIAKKMNDQYAAHGIHVYYCDQVYSAANDSIESYMAAHGYPADVHGGISDTSQMMYLDKDNTWVRKDRLKSALGDPVVDGKAQVGPDSPHNGIGGDARRSTAALGKAFFDIKVEYAVKQIRGFLAQHWHSAGQPDSPVRQCPASNGLTAASTLMHTTRR
jgi:creatinine amidohydrolase/Fe(II)-dependent formamide hydrolase-like protein